MSICGSKSLSDEDLIDPTESLNECLDDTLDQHENPIQALGPLRGYTKIKGFKSLIPTDPNQQPTCHHIGTPIFPSAITPSPPPDHCSSKSSSSVFIPAKTHFPTPNQGQAHNYAKVRNEVPFETVLVTPTPDFSDIPGYTEAIRKIKEEDEQEQTTNTLAQLAPNTS